MKRRRTRARGCTLLEALLVLGCGCCGCEGVRESYERAREERARKDTTKLLVETSVPEALERYNFDIGHYPTEEEGGLNALITRPNFSEETMNEKWRGPYLKKGPVDAWSTALNYEVQTGTDASGLKYKVWSNGPDKQSGTEDDIKSYKEETGA